jgi:FtsH-binding integral membrane protein
MKLKKYKKSSLYLVSVLIGIGLIVIGIVLLLNAFTKGDRFEIIVTAVLLLVWTGFTISNIVFYKNQKRKEETIS